MDDRASTPDRPEPARASPRRIRRAPPRTIVGGVGNNEFVGGTTIKGSILAVDDVLYVTAPDNVWALDATDGHLLWHYFWRTKGGTHIGNRGAAMWRNYLFFVTPDCYLVSLDARTGEERWHKEIANFNQQYFCTSAPIVVENHVIVGTGNDLDSPGYLLSFDPQTGDMQWKFYSVPMNPGDPGTRVVEEPRRGTQRRRPSLDARLLRSGHAALYLRHRQPDTGLHRHTRDRATTCSRTPWSP